MLAQSCHPNNCRAMVMWRLVLRTTTFARRSRHSAMLLSLVATACTDGLTVPTAGGLALQSLAVGSRYSRVVVRGDTAFSALLDGNFAATSLLTGTELWRRKVTDVRVGELGWANPDVAASVGDVMVGDRRDVVAIRRRDGTIRWRYDGAAVAAWAELAIATDGSLVAFAQSRGFATVLDAESGIVRWNRRLLPDDPDTWITSPVFLGDVLVYLRRRNGAPRHGDAVAFAVRASTGDSLWTLTVDTLARISDYAGQRAVAADGDIILSLKRGEILRVSTIDGHVKWRADAPESTPADLREMVMSGSELLASSIVGEGRLQSIDVATGAVNWSIVSPIGSPASPLAINPDNVAFVALGSQLVVVDRKTRSVRHIGRDDLPIGGETGFLSAPTYAGKLLVVPSPRGLFTFRPAS